MPELLLKSEVVTLIPASSGRNGEISMAVLEHAEEVLEPEEGFV